MSDIARRCGSLTTLREPVKQILFDGNAINKRKGWNPNGKPYAALKPSTLRRRPRPGNIPFVTMGESSLIIEDCLIDVRAGVGELSFTQAWPNTRWIEYHRTATPDRAARNPFGFRQIDINDIKEMLGAFVVGRPARAVYNPIAAKPWWKIWGR